MTLVPLCFRQLIVYNAADFEFRTARTYPHMVLIEVDIHDESRFVINAPGMETLYVTLPKPGGAKEVHITCVTIRNLQLYRNLEN